MLNFAKITRRNLQALDAPVKTYAVAQVRESISLDEFAKHISTHNSKYNKADVAGVLTTACECLLEHIRNGNSVNLGDLGTFLPCISSRGVSESEVDEKTGLKPVFTADDITNVSVSWHKGRAFRSLEDVSFMEVETVAARREALKKKKEDLADGTYVPAGSKKKQPEEQPEPQP